MTLNRTVGSVNVSVSSVVLVGQQVNNISVVNVNATFVLIVMPIDSVTRLRLGQIQWGSWQWSADISLYPLPSFYCLGSLVTNSSSRTLVNLVAGTLTVTNLAINVTGMYMLNIHLMSSDNQFNIER